MLYLFVMRVFRLDQAAGFGHVIRARISHEYVESYPSRSTLYESYGVEFKLLNLDTLG